MARPRVTDQSERGAQGVRIVDETVHKHLNHLFRPREKRDLGIDGEIELVDEIDDKRYGTGRLIAVQIKCGLSFFDETDGETYVYRGESKHLEYWSDFSLPVLIVICHPGTKDAYWTEFRHDAVERLDRGWKIRIPRSNLLREASYNLKTIARRNHVDDLIDLSIQAWMHARHTERVHFVGMFAAPRELHWYKHFVEIGGECVMLHWLYARYGRFETDEIRDVVRYLPGNRKNIASLLILCLVGESADSFILTKEATRILREAEGLEVVELIYNRDGHPVGHSIGEYEADGSVSLEYQNGEVIYNEWA